MQHQELSFTVVYNCCHIQDPWYSKAAILRIYDTQNPHTRVKPTTIIEF